MVTWLVYGLALSQIVLFYGFFFPLGVRATHEGYLAKNRPWIEDHPAFRERFHPRYSIWLSYLLGSAWVVLLSFLFFPATERTWLLNSIFFPQAVFLYPVLLFALVVLGYIGIGHFRLYRQIPLAAKRRASLIRRELRDFLNPGWMYLGYLLLAGVVAFNGVACYRGIVDRRATLPGTMAAIVCAAGTAVVLRVSLRRKDSQFDELFGTSFRKFEVILEHGLLYFGVLASSLATLHSVGHVAAPSPITATLAGSVVAQLLVLYVLLGMPFFRRGNPPSSGGGMRSSLGENRRAG